ncbi:hypothetical protein BH09ACT1_BH09ACT1_09430 [soil metagenome]
MNSPTRNVFALGLFGIPLGLAGMGGGWVGAIALLDAPRWPTEVFYALSAALWTAFTVTYLWQGFLRAGRFRDDLTHPATGPFTAFIPAVAILLSSHYAQYLPAVGKWATVGFVAILAIIAAQLVAHWLSGSIAMDSLHGGYFVPVVAGPFIASIGLTTVGLHEAALVIFGAGIFFWLTFGTIVMGRQITGSPLPASVAPALSAFLAAPASAGVAWIISHPGPMDEVQDLLTGVLFIMLFVQLVLINQYRKLRFGLQFWIFTFPVASTTNYLVRWLAASDFAGWRAWAWSILGVSTAFVAVIGIASIVTIVRGRRAE